jgi:hypothetical protein
VGKGLDYWMASDAWKNSDVFDWAKVDGYVSTGLLTNEERDLLHALGSQMEESTENYLEDIPEISAASDRYHEAEKEAPEKFGDIEKIESPEVGGPDDDVDYYSKVPAGEWSDGALPDDLAEPPKVPGQDGGKGGGLAVNTEAIMLFGRNMLELQVLIDTSIEYVKLVDVKPGVFYDGVLLRDKIMSGDRTPGLKGDTFDFMRNTSTAMEHIHADITKLVRDYDTAEELNGVSTQKFEKIMTDSFRDIDYSDQFGNEKSIGSDDGGGEKEEVKSG